MEPICPFCLIDQSMVLKETNLTLIIPDKFPVSPGHSLIILKRHAESFFCTSEKEKKALYDSLSLAKFSIEKNKKPDGYNIGINDGESAGQTINHLHIHLIPRYKGDSKDPRGGIRWIIPDKAPYWGNNE
jgi:diadenosine tetraphosphate (Ap4A) HIT family hydrolase